MAAPLSRISITAHEIEYSVEEANALLPWLRRRLHDMATSARRLEEKQSVVRAIERRARGKGQREIGSERSAAAMAALEEIRSQRVIADSIEAKGTGGLSGCAGAPISGRWATGTSDGGYAGRKRL